MHNNHTQEQTYHQEALIKTQLLFCFYMNLMLHLYANVHLERFWHLIAILPHKTQPELQVDRYKSNDLGRRTMDADYMDMQISTG
jgi:hypothetical protein